MAKHTKKPDYAVYTVINRGEDKPFWMRIGSGWDCEDLSINVELGAMPLNGRLNIRVLKLEEQA